MACAALTACAGGEQGVSSHDGNCTSHYNPVASADTWRALKKTMLASDAWGRVESMRTQASGDKAAENAPGDEKVLRVVDLLDGKGQRLVQVDVWRTGEGWRAGVWSQCID
jgi:hypothetical protein